MNFARIARSHVRSAFAGLVIASVASAQQLWTVDDDAPADFATIQAAVDAAVDGDAILVRAGNYSGFQIVGKGLAVVGDLGAKPILLSSISVTQTTVQQVVVLARLRQIAPTTSGAASGIELNACAGSVRVEDCVFRGQNGPSGAQAGPAGLGVGITQCGDVIFSANSANGGNGFASGYWASDHVYAGGSGGDVFGSQAALFQSDFAAGGAGTSHGIHNIYCDKGGDGLHVDGAFVFSSNCLMLGGQGGCHSLTNNQCVTSFGYGTCGDGGNGLSLTGSACNVQVQQANLASGEAGFTNCYLYASYDDGQPGKLFYRSAPGSIAARVLGVPRTMAAHAFASGTTTVNVTVTGVPGDLVYVVVETAPHFQYDATLHGVWSLSYPPQPAPNPDAVVDATGSVAFPLTLPALAPSQGAQTYFLQPYVIGLAGQTWAGTPRSVTLAKDPSVHHRRQAFARLRDVNASNKLFSVLGPRFKTRPGGYLRILKVSGRRLGDAGEQAIIEFVERTPKEEPNAEQAAEPTKTAAPKAKPAKATKKEAAAKA